MTDTRKPAPDNASGDESQQKRKRLSSALRDNLKRRKAAPRPKKEPHDAGE